MCKRTQAPQSEPFPYSEHILKSGQGAQCLFLNGLCTLQSLTKDVNRQQGEMAPLFVLFFFLSPKLLFALFKGMYCFSDASSEEGPLCCCIFYALSDGTGTCHCFLLKVIISCLGMSVHPGFSCLVFCN